MSWKVIQARRMARWIAWEAEEADGDVFFAYLPHFSRVMIAESGLRQASLSEFWPRCGQEPSAHVGPVGGGPRSGRGDHASMQLVNQCRPAPVQEGLGRMRCTHVERDVGIRKSLSTSSRIPRKQPNSSVFRGIAPDFML